MDYSVLMSVYHKEKAEYLRQSMESMFSQTVLTNDFVLVCDGPLNNDLDAVITEMQNAHSGVLHVVRLKKNMGLGNALNEGIKHCKNELVARMDSDDVSRLDRCEKQIQVFERMPELSIVSGTVQEFSVSIDRVEARRVLPETHNEIMAFVKKRNPFNHPCVMYRKSAVEAVGSYQDFYLLEDYYLWVRMLLNGAKGYNLQEPLLWMRAGSEMYKRRAGWKYAKSQRELFKYLKESRIIKTKEYITSVCMRGISSLVPNWLRRAVFRRILRKQ